MLHTCCVTCSLHALCTLGPLDNWAIKVQDAVCETAIFCSHERFVRKPGPMLLRVFTLVGRGGGGNEYRSESRGFGSGGVTTYKLHYDCRVSFIVLRHVRSGGEAGGALSFLWRLWHPRLVGFLLEHQHHALQLMHSRACHPGVAACNETNTSQDPGGRSKALNSWGINNTCTVNLSRENQAPVVQIEAGFNAHSEHQRPTLQLVYGRECQH